MAFFDGWFIIIPFYLEKFFGIIGDNCSEVNARLGDNFRLWYPINNVYFVVLVTKLWEAWFSTVRDTARHLPQQNTWHSPRLSLHRSSSGASHSVACSSVGRLLPLLTLLLERALQKRAVDGVIHIFVLKPGAQHSLSLFLPLDYVRSIKCVFKSHIRGCGLRTASVTLQKGRHLTAKERTKIWLSQQWGGCWGPGRRPHAGALEPPHLLPFSSVFFRISNPQGPSPTRAGLKSSHLNLPHSSCPVLAPAQPGMWQNCPQSSLIHPYSYLPLGLCPHHFPETVLAQVLVPRTLLSPKFMWLPCHLTLAWSSLSFCKPSSSSGCSPWMSQRLPFLNYLLNSDAPEALCVAFSLPHMLPGPAHPHNFNFNINRKDAHISRPSSDLHLCSGLQTCPTTQQASQSVYTGGTSITSPT